jgi:hypothetical protein
MTNVDVSLSRKINALVREDGVFKSDNKVYVSLAHTDRDVSDAIDAFKRAAETARSI